LIGVLLRANNCDHDDEELKLRSRLKEICEMVDASKATAALKLVEEVYNGLRKDLQGLFLDIALFIVPSFNYGSYLNGSGEEGAISILSKLRGSSRWEVKLKVRPKKSNGLGMIKSNPNSYNS
jgi:hypothetical protein